MKKLLIQIFTSLIPVKSVRKKARTKLHKTFIKVPISKIQKHYETTLNTLKEKVKNGEKIRVGFSVVFDSVFPAKPLFEKMLDDDLFEPFIIIIPDTARGEENMLSLLNKSYETFSQKYKNVYLGYDKKNNNYIDFSDKMDLICLANPYDSMTHKYFTIEYLQDKNALPFYMNYSYFTLIYTQNILNLDFFNYLWKAFLDSDLNADEFKKTTLHKNDNVGISVGYCKMDSLANKNIISRKHKKIIIAPHHTVREWKNGLELSNFLTYSDLFLELPKMYPDIDFVFRPHPLLFVALKCDDLWGQEKTEKYLADLQANPNCVYSDGGDYLDIFANSDGIIHDCGSFTLEYLFTENPSCYLLKDIKEIDETFTQDGKNCLEHHYNAFIKQDILDFINNVIIKGQDEMKEDRIKFVKETLKTNYPHTTDIILNHIKMELEAECIQ